jgi:GNAT superfamily N-acetyltransferase
MAKVSVSKRKAGYISGIILIMSQSLKIRPAVRLDAPELSRLSAQLGYPCAVEQLGVNLLNLEKDPDHEVFVAEIGEDVLAGFVHVFVTRRLFLETFGELGGLVVDECRQGSGIGGQLLIRAEDWAFSRGCREMRVRSNTKRQRAREFYLGQGYHQHKQQNVFLKRAG